MATVNARKVKISLSDSFLRSRQTELKKLSKTGSTESGFKVQRIADAGHRGLSIEIRPDGGMSWRFRYLFENKANMVSLGTYPEISLAEARKRAEKARENVALRKDPSRLKKAERSEKLDTFAKVVMRWHKVNPKKLDPDNAKAVLRRLEIDILPYLGDTPIKEITTADLYTVLMQVWNRGSEETAYRLSGWCKQVFKYARGMGMDIPNPVTDELRENFRGAVSTNFSAITQPDDVKGLMASLLDYKGTQIMRCALQLWAMTFVRPGNLRCAEWSEIHGLDTDAPEWRIPAMKMKMRYAKKIAGLRPFVVPLSRQAVEVIKEIKPITGGGKFLFPSPRSLERPMSENGILSSLRRMGYSKEEMCGHGIRATARTICREVLGYDVDVIEEQLAHGKGGALGTAYDRTEHMPARKRMMQAWADWLYGLVSE